MLQNQFKAIAPIRKMQTVKPICVWASEVSSEECFPIGPARNRDFLMHIHRKPVNQTLPCPPETNLRHKEAGI
jgi:hypothetical protein